jgi:hypothetical protein
MTKIDGMKLVRGQDLIHLTLALVNDGIDHPHHETDGPGRRIEDMRATEEMTIDWEMILDDSETDSNALHSLPFGVYSTNFIPSLH